MAILCADRRSAVTSRGGLIRLEFRNGRCLAAQIAGRAQRAAGLPKPVRRSLRAEHAGMLEDRATGRSVLASRHGCDWPRVPKRRLQAIGVGTSFIATTTLRTSRDRGGQWRSRPLIVACRLQTSDRRNCDSIIVRSSTHLDAVKSRNQIIAIRSCATQRCGSIGSREFRRGENKRRENGSKSGCGNQDP